MIPRFVLDCFVLDQFVLDCFVFDYFVFDRFVLDRFVLDRLAVASTGPVDRVRLAPGDYRLRLETVRRASSAPWMTWLFSSNPRCV